MKIRMLSIWVLPVAISGMLSGCEHYQVQELGRSISKSEIDSIIRGVTTKKQIRAKFGRPTDSTIGPTLGAVWRYCHSPGGRIEHLSIQGVDMNNREWTCVGIEFSPDGIVKDIAVSQFLQELDGEDKATKSNFSHKIK